MSFESQVTALLDCVCEALARVGWEGECCLEAGPPVDPELCCETPNQAWGRLVSVRPDVVEGEARPVDSASNVRWVLTVELGATFCVCDDGCDCEAKGVNASNAMALSEAALQGAVFCYADAACGPDVSVVELTTTGPEAMCGGFLMTVNVGYALCRPAT